MVETLGAEITKIEITDLRNDTFFAQITLDVDGRTVEVDSRPSDAVALAVRARVPVFVARKVMDQAAITPERDLTGAIPTEGAENVVEEPEPPEAFRDFLEGLDLSGLE